MRLLTDDWLATAAVMAHFWWRWYTLDQRKPREIKLHALWRDSANGETGGFD